MRGRPELGVFGLGVFGLGLLAAGLVAAALADLLGRAAGFGALGAGNAPDRVALTFDDGPSPRTPELRAVLERHGAQATFFVLEAHCRAFPAEVQALRDAGHQLESHGRWHRHALLLPGQEWAQVRWHPDGPDRNGGLYRPPYGGHSPLTRLLARLAGREIALWDTESRDWTAAPAADLAAQTLARVRPGSVVLLHDGPAVTPELLDLLLRGLHGRGLRPVRLGDLPPQRIGWRAGLRRLRQSYGG
ncbi:polysaccharide deacetylase family protein [Deinococcus wulumuqiensis]|uniref:Polysaccharide deacetylase n=1 Tax=Deinococcus wulumuqiensis TaxID=980427 RepID=A0AAV4K5B9_9DEIO|nr:polysaccharide deacetylase family protein [Deinococcus wulumuqiensis]QII20360.1 polysaccharide deacetylase family protein [Deinococcus wulumuqiensis R12]GGI82486.1 polysaccharide deacetylase [Deinococcus wulumuqiensis]GGP29466.1 polysaccharide deacetylase [Deinococcus wulumuqiensis]